MENIKTLTWGNNGVLSDEKGRPAVPPVGWIFLPAGDAAVTRKVTSKGLYWKVVFRKGRRIMSKGVWAPEEIVKHAVEDVRAMRSGMEYQSRLESGRRYRQKKQEAYRILFYEEVKKFLSFHMKFREMEEIFAGAVTEHAVPVGSGTVARTEMIPVQERASRAVIAWMRHKTTAYDTMTIPRIKGMRRETRRLLAKKSSEVLESYRRGDDPSPKCPLKTAIDNLTENKSMINGTGM